MSDDGTGGVVVCRREDFTWEAQHNSMPRTAPPAVIRQSFDDVPNFYYYWMQAVKAHASTIFAPDLPWESSTFLQQARFDPTWPVYSKEGEDAQGSGNAIAGLWWSVWTGPKDTAVSSPSALRPYSAIS